MMTTGFAADTSVPVERSKAEIERLIVTRGATQFVTSLELTRALVMFRLRNRVYRFDLPLPDARDKRFTHTDKGRARSAAESGRAYEQGIRSAWRALALTIKSKMVAVDAGIESFEQAFLAHVVLPNGKTLCEWAETELPKALAEGHMPHSLLALTSGED